MNGQLYDTIQILNGTKF